MQWFIDIITGLFGDRHRFFDRGDPNAYDFALGDFVQDNTWRDMDLSPVVPDTAVLVLLRVVYRATTAQDILNFRTNGNVNVFNVVQVRSRIANVRTGLDVKVAPDGSRVIEYKCLQGNANLINVSIAGWWLE